MHKKFEINRTEIKGGYQSERKVVSHNSKSDLPLESVKKVYKFSGFGDMPTEFNVSLLRGAPNPKAVFSSKAVGEPPLFLASSVFFGVKEAIRSARVERGLSKKFDLDAPATAERIRMACEDHLTNKTDQLPPRGTYKPWGIQL